jgi:hypothetical protein
MKPEVSLSYSQEPTTSPSPELDEFSSHVPTLWMVKSVIFFFFSKENSGMWFWHIHPEIPTVIIFIVIFPWSR